MLSICERSLWTLTAPRGPIPVVRLGRSIRYRVADLDAYLQRAAQGGGHDQ
jgi:predicted enzyme related to lactoylglutathione lyase